MARGESPKDRPSSVGIALIGAVGLAALLTLFCVVSSMRGFRGDATVSPYPTPGLGEPFVGASTSFGVLGSRDSARATAYYGGALAPDPTAARPILEGTLASRGYVVGTSAESPILQMPFDFTPTDLDGSCGVVLLIGDLGALIQRAGVLSGDTFSAIDPSAFTVATCGTAPVHVEGIGGATARVWLFPGLTPSTLASTGLTADALLAHAEAETLLRRLGYEPVDEVIELGATSTGAGAFATLDAPHLPSSGCIPFVAYVVGAGRATLPFGRSDYLDDRALSATVGCASGTGWALTLVDDGTLGATAFVRAYRAGGGPTSISTASSITLVDGAHASWPVPITESPTP
jgi:hypothetical protein